jgi:hypothetical protein
MSIRYIVFFHKNLPEETSERKAKRYTLVRAIITSARPWTAFTEFADAASSFAAASQRARSAARLKQTAAADAGCHQPHGQARKCEIGMGHRIV